MQKLNHRLSQLPSDYGKTLRSRMPSRCNCLMEHSWLLKHARIRLKDGSCICSPSVVNESLPLQHVTRLWSDWQNSFLDSRSPAVGAAPTCRHVYSNIVSNFGNGYKTQAWRAGYPEASAVQVSEHKVFQLVDHIDYILPKQFQPILTLVMERDIMLVLLMSDTSLHGSNCAEV